MKIFSSHRKKLDARRRFGSRDFQNKIKAAQNYKRVFSGQQPTLMDKIWMSIGLKSRFWRWFGLILLLVIFYFFTISSQLVIADVRVSGNAEVSSQQIQDIITQYANSRIMLVKHGNYFLMSQGRVNDILTSRIPVIKEITGYHRIWPNKLELSVKERTPGFALVSNSKYFLIDDEGTVVKPIDGPGKLLLVEDSVVEDFALGEVMQNSKMAPFIISMNRAWPSKLSTSIKSVRFPGKASNEVQFTSAEGWTVFFDINRSVNSQLASLSVILSKQIPVNSRPNLAYIDLRLSNWAYYCYNNTPCHQQPIDVSTPK